MNVQGEVPVCPHCGAPLQAFELPDNTGWQTSFQLACFNDDCGYYQRGWVWMFDHYGVKASYRYRVEPDSGKASPLAVWSKTAMKDRILDGDVVASVVPGNDVAAGEAGERAEGTGESAPSYPGEAEEEYHRFMTADANATPSREAGDDHTKNHEPPQKREGE